MVADNRAPGDGPAGDIPAPAPAKPRRGPELSYDAKIAPTCMFWAMVIGLAFMLGTMLLWGIGNIGTVFR